MERRATTPGRLDRRALIAGATALVATGPAATRRALAADPWQLLRAPGTVALMRHATAPGVGDPAGFRIGACATQRNLDDRGRAEATRARARFEANGVAFDLVYSSQWCRCLETARLVTGREPLELTELNSFFGDRARQPAQIAALRRKLAALPEGSRTLMVTHQVVISALTGVAPASGEIVIVRTGSDGATVVTGRLQPDRD